MQKRKLSKLQIRAEVLSELQKLQSLSDIRSKTDEIIVSIQSIEDTQAVIDTLCKEIIRVTDEKRDLIAFLITEIAELNDVQQNFWSLIKSPDTSDELKEIYANILRVLGENIDTDTLISFLTNPEEIIDKETKKLLEVANYNPESQIDFLDFFFALGDNEKIQLINSLKEDYPGEELASILVPALESMPSENIQEALIEALGESKSYIGVQSLNNIIQYSKDLKLQQLANTNIKKLKLAGINTNNAEKVFYRDSEICSQSTPFHCYSSFVDGNGNQGIVFSRTNNENQINMFSTVINDTDGIVDCFGFSFITQDEFNRIIERFSRSATVFRISPQFCKSILLDAELINKHNNSSIPYEYSAWKTLLFDIQTQETKTEVTHTNNENIDYKKLSSINDINTWFLNENTSETIKEFLRQSINCLCEDIPPHEQNVKVEQIISNTAKKYFDDYQIKIYQKRLYKISQLFELNEQYDYAQLFYSIASTLDISNIEQNIFIRDILKKSIIEALLRKKELDDENQPKTIFTRKKQTTNDTTKLTNEKIDNIVNFLREIWNNEL